MKNLILFCILVTICCATFAQQTSVNTTTTLEERIEQLQQENTELKKQFEEFKEETRQSYIDLKNDETNRFNGYVSHVGLVIGLMGAFITIIVAVVGFFVPYMQNRTYGKMLEGAKSEIDLKLENITNQLSEMRNIETEMSNIKDSVVSTNEQTQKSAKETEANRLFTEALNENNLNKKIELYTKSIKLNLEFSVAYNNRGNAKADLKQYDEAISDFNKAIELNHNNDSYYYNRGNAKADLEQYEQAISDYNEAIRLNSNKDSYYFNRGNAKADLKQYEQAISDYNEAIRLNPKEGDYYFSRGITKAKLEQYGYEEVISDYNEAIKLDHYQERYYFTRAMTYRKMANDERYADQKEELVAKVGADEYCCQELEPMWVGDVCYSHMNE